MKFYIPEVQPINHFTLPPPSYLVLKASQFSQIAESHFRRQQCRWASKGGPLLYKQANQVFNKGYAYETEMEKNPQRLMNTANHKPVFRSAGLSIEKTSRCKFFARIKARSNNLIDPPFLQFGHLW